MAGPSWQRLAQTLAVNLGSDRCSIHNDPYGDLEDESDPRDCPYCTDAAAVTEYRTVVAQAKSSRGVGVSGWRDVAFTLAARMRHHADQCSDHTGKRLPKFGECAFCDDTRSWRDFARKATAEGLHLPDQDHHDMRDAAHAINVFDVIRTKDTQ
ncbi:hypothetical protein [Curtobacterium sp. MCSS17_016]|uniref:hypothetical protein n=1 Tax=Curtobacterium sp. MCSS17_016 TaxID=2175644 RepID=UPI000DA8DA18|nr:hypothetical protein [Curtobacterium sp. MCSS17_016]WIE81303.1 hypothetical protein DEJ19_018895 [Curtobacterium sp. MCSS17_016]